MPRTFLLPSPRPGPQISRQGPQVPTGRSLWESVAVGLGERERISQRRQVPANPTEHGAPGSEALSFSLLQALGEAWGPGNSHCFLRFTLLVV